MFSIPATLVAPTSLCGRRSCSFTVRVTATGGHEALAEPNISSAKQQLHGKEVTHSAIPIFWRVNEHREKIV